MTPGYFPLPAGPVGLAGFGDFVPGRYPLPQQPVGYVQAGNGQLPKAADLTTADLALTPATDGDPCAGMGGCGCAGCSGMGDLMIGTFDVTTLIPGTTFGIPNTYLVAGVLAAALIFMGSLYREIAGIASIDH